MRQLLAVLVVTLAAALLHGETRDKAILLSVNDAIGPAIADYLERGLDKAHDAGAEIVIIQLDTPGGLDLAMRSIIRAVIASPVPVAIHVAPPGARAASAGTYMLYAAHVAAMAPGTNLALPPRCRWAVCPAWSRRKNLARARRAINPIPKQWTRMRVWMRMRKRRKTR